MRILHTTLAAVAIAAALSLTACTPSTPAPTSTREATAPTAIATPTSTPTSTPAPVAAPLDTITAPASCQEDEPCWDCATMGNLVCGPVDQPLAISAADVTTPSTPAPKPREASVLAPPVVKAPAPAPVAPKPTQTPTAPATVPTPPVVVTHPACNYFDAVGTSVESFYTDNNAYCPPSAVHLTGALFTEDAAKAEQLYGYTGKYTYAYTTATKPTSGIFTPSLWIAPMVYHVFTPVTPVPCSQLKLGDGGTTQQHNCTTAAPAGTVHTQ